MLAKRCSVGDSSHYVELDLLAVREINAADVAPDEGRPTGATRSLCVLSPFPGTYG
jgi:hypothetical protein